MSEWSNVPAWKASIPQGIGGSNPLLSATKKPSLWGGFFVAERRGKRALQSKVRSSSLRLCLNEESCQRSPLAGYGSILDLKVPSLWGGFFVAERSGKRALQSKVRSSSLRSCLNEESAHSFFMDFLPL